MATVLIVDDSAVERSLAGGLLQASPDFLLRYAENGKEALERIAEAPPDVVVTDLIMPEMDGLELVRAVRHSYPCLPVILMTAYGNEGIAAESLRAGAVSYVPKSQRAQILLQTVCQVLDRSTAASGHQWLSKNLHHIEATYVLENDPSLLKPLLDMVGQTLASMGVCDETGRMRVGVAIEEALLNAIYHGNLSITKTSYAEARRIGISDPTASLRCKQSPYCDRAITFKMRIARDGADFVIRDEGEGCRAVIRQPPGSAQDVFERGQNRGISLMRYLTDEVRYNDAGNEVKLSLRV